MTGVFAIERSTFFWTLIGKMRFSGSTRCSHICRAGRRLVHHEARLTCLEENRQPTLEVAQEEIATPKACTSTGQELISVEHLGV